MKLSVIIPVYNEKKTILEILRRVEEVNLSHLKFEKEIIIIDDGSTDGTKEILVQLEDKNRYKIIYLPKNSGKGTAIRAGLREASGDYVIIQDADLEYDPEDYKKLLECALQNNADVVYGSRILDRQNPNKISYISYYLGGIFLSWITNILYRTKITDESACYKLFKVNVIKSIPLECKKFEFCPEITAKVAKKGIKIYEVPIKYYPRRKEEGKKIKWVDGFQALWTLIKYKFFD